MNRLLFLLTTAFFTLFPAAGAHPAEVTLEDCLHRATEGNSGLKAQAMSIEEAESRRMASRASFFPTLKFTAHYALTDQPGRLIVEQDSLGQGLPERDIDLSDDRHDTYQAALRLSQPLFTGGSLTHAFARSGHQLDAAGKTWLYRRDLLLQEVTRTFYQALAAEVQKTAAAKNLTALESGRRITVELQKEGYATDEDLLVAESLVREAEARSVQLNNQFEMSLARLRQLINAPPSEPLTPAGELCQLRIDAPLEEFLQEGAPDRNDLQAWRSQVRQSEEEIGIARSGYFPTISLETGYLQQRETHLTDPSVWSVMVSADWRLFDFGRTEADVRRAAALARRDTLQLEELRKNVMVEVEDLWRQAQTEHSHLLSREARLKAAEHALLQVISRRLEGKARQVDLLRSEASLWREYGDYAQAASLLQGLVAALERAWGKPLGNRLVRTPLHRIDFQAITEGIAAATHLHAAAGKPGTTTRPRPAADRLAVQEHQENRSGPPCRLQLGAFVHRGNAERFLGSMNNASAARLKLSIVTEKEMYKVMSDFFPSRDEALRTAEELGIRAYLLKL